MSGEGERMVKVVPVTAERWGELERLFGPYGASYGCWCMYWRLTAQGYEEGRKERGAANRAGLKGLVDGGAVPGLLAYVDGEPAGWVSLGPREAFPRFASHWALRPVDEEPVWSIVCFFVGRAVRGRGLQRVLIGAAVDHARAQGARIVEAYPTDPGEGRGANVFTGLADAFREAGFVEVARRKGDRPVMRLVVE
jgi:GNAT superfamily N-acetyltransferase